MSSIRATVGALLLGLALLTLLAGVVAVRAGNYFDLGWHTVDGGGHTSSGGAYSLSGTIGQPDAGLLAGGGYELGGGFWGGGVLSSELYELYLPLTTRGQ